MCYLYMNNDKHSNLLTNILVRLYYFFCHKETHIIISHYLYYCDGFELAYTVVSGNRIEGLYLCYCDAFELAYTVVSDNWIGGLYSSAYSYFWIMYSLSFS